ncbi:RBBP9/YdeN family alpha/beta hydrolase [Shewanella surugensis]|uniref:RBBP9/YdeN family alpha/beta hydrolase n=1 Tax=Shewanella surugensis TaxID=212020 RepID=UPI00289CD2FB|nr:alpha/beta hydrolase [Shewanella surugensis]
MTHSLGGCTVAEWNRCYPVKAVKIKGAFLVAVPDVLRDDFPDVITGYDAPPLDPLPFSSVMCASTNDPYSSFERSRLIAQQWGCEFISVGALGHINTESNIGDWPEGQHIFDEFVKKRCLKSGAEG